jgi:hypothetical protein
VVALTTDELDVALLVVIVVVVVVVVVDAVEVPGFGAVRTAKIFP